MKKPTPKQLDAIQRLQGPLFDEFLGWLHDNREVANDNLDSFEGAEMHRTQGDHRTLKKILTTTDGAYAARQGSERAGRANTR